MDNVEVISLGLYFRFLNTVQMLIHVFKYLHWNCL